MPEARRGARFSQASFKNGLPTRGLGYRDFSNIRLDEMLPFCLNWEPLGLAESLRSRVEEKSPSLAPALAWEWACGRPLPGTRLATEPALPQLLGHRSADKAAFPIQTWPS